MTQIHNTKEGQSCRQLAFLCSTTDRYLCFSVQASAVSRPSLARRPTSTIRLLRLSQTQGHFRKGRTTSSIAKAAGRFGWLRDWIKDRASRVQHDQWFALYRNDGVVDDYTFIDGVRRGNFRLHPNGRFGVSEGCITILSQAQFDKLRQFLLAQETKVIPGTNIKYYGTVEVR